MPRPSHIPSVGSPTEETHSLKNRLNGTSARCAVQVFPCVRLLRVDEHDWLSKNEPLAVNAHRETSLTSRKTI